MITKREFIKELDQTEQDIVSTRYATALKKTQFINELKNGLGQEMKKNPNAVKIIKKSRYKKFISWVKKLFIKL